LAARTGRAITTIATTVAKPKASKKFNLRVKNFVAHPMVVSHMISLDDLGALYTLT
jgi:hypothetical protein